MVRSSGFFLFLLGCVIYTAGNLSVYAQNNSHLFGKLQSILADTKLRQHASLEGQDRALICSYCHGKDGNSVREDVPNLAGQNPVYLLEQIDRFANGTRKDFVMNSLAGKFTEADRINLAVYYSGKTVKPGKFDRHQVAKGQVLYQKNCQACHGVKGGGSTRYARLAGQKQAYIESSLLRFKNNVDSKTAGKKRQSRIMGPIANQLSEVDIKSLAAYVASIR